jgi:hypothetical protein
MPWITIKEPWTHVESIMQTTVYQPGKHNVTADIEAAFKARTNNGDADHPDQASGSISVEGGDGDHSDSASEGHLSTDDA